jgi:hypothetical protein
MCTIKGIERTVLWVLGVLKRLFYALHLEPYTFFLYILVRNKA